MGKKLNNKNVGLACVILGGIFFLSGMVLFVLFNYVNLYAQKAEATIVARYYISDPENPHTMLELAYRVGDDMIYSVESTTEEIPEDEVNRDIYYNVKNPKEVIDAGWHLEPIIPACFGILILMTGLYYMGIISFGIEPAKKPGSNASDWDKKYYDAKERVENDVIPLFGLISFIVFGIFVLVNKTGWWAWIFIIVGGVGVIYILMDLIPTLAEFSALTKIKKYKNNSLSVDDDFEKFEKKLKEKEKKKEAGKDEFEVEETIEITSLKINKKKKK